MVIRRFGRRGEKIIPNRKRIFSVALITLVAAIIGRFAFPVRADVYMYLDEDGVVHFTNTPTSSDDKLYIEEPIKSLNSSQMSDRYDGLIRNASNQYEIAFPLLKALIKVESDFDPYAVSRRGAKGLMQLMPDNIAVLRIKNVFDPSENIMGGAKYFKQLLNTFEENIPMALAAYNAGPKAVLHFGTIPPYGETEAFVNKVMTYYHLLNFNRR